MGRHLTACVKEWQARAHPPSPRAGRRSDRTAELQSGRSREKCGSLRRLGMRWPRRSAPGCGYCATSSRRRASRPQPPHRSPSIPASWSDVWMKRPSGSRADRPGSDPSDSSETQNRGRADETISRGVSPRLPSARSPCWAQRRSPSASHSRRRSPPDYRARRESRVPRPERAPAPPCGPFLACAAAAGCGPEQPARLLRGIGHPLPKPLQSRRHCGRGILRR